MPDPATELRLLADVVAHDLKSPLSAVAGLADFVAQHPAVSDDPQLRHIVDRIRGSALRSIVLIDGLAAYFRVAAQPPVMSIVDVGAVVHQALDDLAEEVQATGARVTVDDLPMVHGDADQLTVLFVALVGNAIRFTHRGQEPIVEVSASRQERRWVVVVADHGIGIDPDHSQRAFDLFVRLHGSDFPGAGAGLAVAKRVVDNHGGKIWIEPNQPSGSRVACTLAAAD